MNLPQFAREQYQHPEVTYLIEETRDLVSPPQVHFALLEVLNDPDATAQDMAEIVSLDPALTARLLRIVNSPYYGMQRRIDTISRAVTVIGINDLFNLAVAVSATAVFARLPSSLVSMDTFWRHSVYTAMMARELAKRCDVLHPERLFVAGILHDVGSLLLYNERPDTMAELLMISQGDEEVLFQAECDRLGFSHADVGAGILAVWQLPGALCAAVGSHHTPLESPQKSRESCLVHLADYMANRNERGGFTASTRFGEGIDTQVLEVVQLDTTQLAEAAGAASDCFEQTIGLFLP